MVNWDVTESHVQTETIEATSAAAITDFLLNKRAAKSDPKSNK